MNHPDVLALGRPHPLYNKAWFWGGGADEGNIIYKGRLGYVLVRVCT